MNKTRFITRWLSGLLAGTLFLGGIPFEYCFTSKAYASGSIVVSTPPPPDPIESPTPPTPCSGSKSGLPVYFFNGEKNFDELLVDFSEPFEPLDLRVQYFAQSDTVGLFGQSWFLNWQKSAQLEGTVPP